ncbi:hypothetical protein ACFFRR_011308 [Megaselia abdita]
MARKNKPRLIPVQDKRICGSICLCQLTMVLSCVSIVYLSVIIYTPSFKVLQSGYELEPVLCQTIDRQMLPNNCPWASCGEWCLTKTSGFCPQIHTTVRRNGTDIQLNNCQRITNTSCPQFNKDFLTNFNCNNGSICSNLEGVFNCSNGHCKNMSQHYLCYNYKADGHSIDPDKENTKLNGFFECHKSKCTTIKQKDFPCERYCNPISTANANVLIMHDNSLLTAECDDVLAFTEARGNELGIKIDATEIWNDTTDTTLLTNCMTVEYRDNTIVAKDCLNGTIIPNNSSMIPYPTMNFSVFWNIYETSNIDLDPTQRFLPKQSVLTIYNSSKLYINLEGCVNTLRGECIDFVESYGNDGREHTGQSKYPCFYHKQDSTFALTRHDPDKTYRELLITMIVPSVLFVISSISLCIISKTIKVGDDAKMRCICCNEDGEDGFETLDGSKNKQNRYDDYIAGDDEEILEQESNIH